MKNLAITSIFIFILSLASISSFAEDIEFSLDTNVITGAGKNGDIMQLFLSAKNTASRPISGDFYLVIIQPNGTVLFYPDWSGDMQKIEVTIPENLELINFELFILTFGGDILSDYGEYTIACGFMEGDKWVSNFGMTSFHYLERDWFKLISGNDRYGVGKYPNPVTSADVNNDGFIDMMVSNIDSDDVSVLLNRGDGTFRLPQRYFVGEEPNQVTVSDVNNDGYVDMLVSNYWSGDVSVIINRGDGTFNPEQRFYVGTKPNRVTTSDINNDGYIDLLMSSTRWFNKEGYVDVFFNKGNGNFLDPIRYEMEGPAQQVEAADVNNDGYQDMLVSNWGEKQEQDGHVLVFLNNGDGAFPNQDLYYVGRHPKMVTSADVNNDGYLDMLISRDTHQYKGNVSVLINKGNGSFHDQVWYDVGIEPRRVTAADVNNNGFIDMLVANAERDDYISDNTLSILFNRGNGTFGSEIRYDTGSYPRQVTASDINNDKYIDMLVISGGAVFMFTNDGKGGFGNKVIIEVDSSPQRVEVADIDNDNYLDILVSNERSNDLVVMLNNRDGTFDQDILLKIGEGTEPVTASDINNNGYKDILVSNGYADDKNDYVSVLINKGDVSFEPEVRYEVGDSPRKVTVTDIDKDGFIDMLVSNHSSGNLSVFLNQGDGTFKKQVLYNVGGDPEDITLADINNDGFTDMLVSTLWEKVTIFLNEGNGLFANKFQYRVGSAPNQVSASDINCDGFVDMLISNRFSNDVSVFINQGNGVFKWSFLYDVGDSPEQATVSDINNDGFVDMLVSNSGSDDISVLFNNGDRTFKDQIRYPANSPSEPVVAYDINNDGYQDMISVNLYKDNLSLFVNKGDGTFKPEIIYELGKYPTQATLADINNDGYIDVLVSNDGNANVSILLNRKDGNFAHQVQYFAGSGPNQVTACDINNDGFIDMLISGSFYVSLLINSGIYN